MASPKTPTSVQKEAIDATWRRYRQLITSLQGVHGEVIAAHLTIEAQLEQRLERLIPHPEILLSGAGFHQKLNLFSGLHPGPEPLNGDVIQQIRRLNKIRNMIAHGDGAATIAAELDGLLCQSRPEYRSSDKSPAAACDALRGLTMAICGYLVGVTEGDHFDALRRLMIDGKTARSPDEQ